MMAITPHTAIVDTEFLYIRILHERLYRIADTSSIPQINNKHIIPYKIAVPPLAEQRKIAEVLGVWDEAIEKQARLIEKLALRKRALMQRLLSAKLRLPGFSKHTNSKSCSRNGTKPIAQTSPYSPLLETEVLFYKPNPKNEIHRTTTNRNTNELRKAT